MLARLVHEAGSWVIDTDRRELKVDGAPVPIGSRAFEIIETLVTSAGRFVTKDELMAQVWPGVIVEEQTLRVHISAIRKALGPDRVMLKTASGRGYLLVGDWTVEQEDTRARRGDLALERVPDRKNRGNLPAALSDLIGRASAIQEVSDLISAYRVVTLTGSGGIGKTKLCIEVARTSLAEFEDGAWLVELASLSDPNLIPPTVANVLGLKLGGEIISPDAVARAIGGKKILMILDNCEHVVEAAADLVGTIVRQCPRATVLATSREVLRTDGERIYRLPPLEIPASDREKPEHLLQRTAVELLIARTQALNADFSPSMANYAAIAAICRHLDGIPLAIEFAAARVATLGVHQVAAALTDRFELLRSRRRTALPRHQTLRATLDWSYRLLPGAEQSLLRCLSIFAGGFTIKAATAIMNEVDRPNVMDGLSNLVSKSLVMLHDTGGNSRFRMLETIRAYALEKLKSNGETALVSQRHVEYFYDLFAPAESSLPLRAAPIDVAQSIREIDNVRSALDCSFSSSGSVARGIDLAAAYTSVWLHFDLLTECRERCEQALSAIDPDTKPITRSYMRLQNSLGNALIATVGPTSQATSATIKALEIATIRDDLEAQARALGALIPAFLYLLENGEARIAIERLRQIGHRLREPTIIARADRLLGNTLLNMGKPREAQQCLERVLQATTSAGDQQRTVWNHSNEGPMARSVLSLALLLQGFAERAYNEARTCVEELRGTQHQTSFLFSLYSGMGRVALMTGNLDAADRTISQIIAFATTSNLPFWSSVGHCLEGKLMIERGEFAAGVELLQDAFEASDRTGWRQSYPEFKGALAMGLAGLGQVDRALATIDEAIASSGHDENGQVWFLPELLRIKGELVLQRGTEQSTSEAGDWFGRAGEVAREQGALFWELRIALSLARLREAQNRSNERGELLTSVYKRFTEGFSTADLKAARIMLDTVLSGSDLP